jgi:hypothetical protein
MKVQKKFVLDIYENFNFAVKYKFYFYFCCPLSLVPIYCVIITEAITNHPRHLIPIVVGWLKLKIYYHSSVLRLFWIQ